MSNNTIQNRIAFKATPDAKTLTTINDTISEIKILKLNKDDMPFIEDLSRKIKIEELLPNEPKPAIYQKIVNSAFEHILLKKDRDAFIAIKGNKPCAIMTTRDDYNAMNLVYLAALPVKFNEKVSNAGKSMVRHFLSLFEKSENTTGVVYPEMKNIDRLEPFYKKCGFTSSLAACWRMTMQKKDLPQIINKIEKDFQYHKINNAKDIDLFEKLNTF